MKKIIDKTEILHQYAHEIFRRTIEWRDRNITTSDLNGEIYDVLERMYNNFMNKFKKAVLKEKK